MLRKFFLILLLLPCSLYAQYFQQELSYKINVLLDDSTNYLHADLTLEYTNNSPDTLDKIIFHCWPRAYATDRSAFARQQLRIGNTDFHFSNDSQRGNMDGLDFRVNGIASNWYFDQQHTDIAIVQLPSPLPSGQTVSISTPFSVKIPHCFSRLGHKKGAYQITQWYPKPAVYDRDGWHDMPYLDNGEFYSEFGDFEVNITLPENYIVASTGMLNTASELQFLEQRALQDADDISSSKGINTAFIPSSKVQKTIKYLAKNVHDFAWFADKRFKVLSKNLNTNIGSVKLWSFFPPEEAKHWTKSIDYTQHAIEFYSKKIGDYPYPQVSVVQSEIGAGGGMEYPMVTVIRKGYRGESLDKIIAHEVGHNWFYGILASNERKHPWMDEGFNSYYEELYMKAYYPEYSSSLNIMGQNINIDLIGYRYQNRLCNGQKPSMDADSMHTNNYWLNAYSKPDLALQHLAKIYGQQALDSAMQHYYNQWKFKHPSPNDAKVAFEQSLNTSLDWLFDDLLMGDKTIDYCLEKGPNRQLIVKQNGEINVPVIVNDLVATEESSSVVIDHDETNGYTLSEGNYFLDAGPLDLQPINNFTKHPLKLQFLLQPEANNGSKQFFYSPLASLNAQNGLMLGAALHNRPFEPKKIEFMLAPMFGFKSKSINGFAGLRWKSPMRSSNTFRLLTLASGVQRFAYRAFLSNPFHYYRLGLSAQLSLKHAPIKNLKSSIRIQLVGLAKDVPKFERNGDFAGNKAQHSSYLRFSYNRKHTDPINPRSIGIQLEQGFPGGALEEAFSKLSVTIKGGYQYQQYKFVRWRLFGGYFLKNPLRKRNLNTSYNFSLVGNAASDYAYDNLFIGRQDDRSYGQQLSPNAGGFRIPIDPALGFGRSNNYILALNLDASLPFAPRNFPLGVFLDVANYDRSPIRRDNELAVQWAAGVSLSFLDGAVGIYLPILASEELKNTLSQRGGILQQLGFSLSISDWYPWKKIDTINL